MQRVILVEARDASRNFVEARDAARIFCALIYQILTVMLNSVQCTRNVSIVCMMLNANYTDDDFVKD